MSHQSALGDLWTKAAAEQEATQKKSNEKKEDYEIEYNVSSTAAAKDWLAKKGAIYQKYYNDQLIVVQKGVAKAEGIQTAFEVDSLQRRGQVRAAAVAKIEASYEAEKNSLEELRIAGADVSVLLTQLEERRATAIERTQGLPEVDPNIALRQYFGFSAADVSEYMRSLEEADEFAQFGQHENDPAAKFEAEMAAENERHQLVMEALRAQLEEKLLTQQEYNERMRKENEFHAAQTTHINQNQMDSEMSYHHAKLSALSHVLNSTSQLFSAFSKKSKGLAIAAFLFSKAAAAADVIVSTQVAIMRAFKDFGPIKGAPLAAAMALAGKISLLAIAASTIGGVSQISSGGGGGARPSTPTPTSGGGSTTVPTSSINEPDSRPTTILIDTHGRSVFDAEDLRMLAKDLVENYGQAFDVRSEVI